MILRILLSIIAAVFVSSCGEESLTTNLNNNSAQNTTSCNQAESNYPCLEIGTYSAVRGYYKLNMPEGGGKVIVNSMNNGRAFIYTTDLIEYEINSSLDTPNQLPNIESTFLPKGEYLIFLDANDLGRLTKISINSTGIIDQSLLNPLQARTYTSADTDDFTAYYKLNIPAGGGNIIANGVNQTYALIYTASLDKYNVNPDSNISNQLPNNITTYLPEGGYVVAVTTEFGTLSSISFAFSD